MTSVAVVGGGITGLAAALRLRDRLGPAAQITIYEQGSELGGKLRTGRLAGVPAEYGADAFLMRDPSGAGDSAAVTLARRVGVADQVVHPSRLPPAILLDGELQPVPGGTLLGVPGDLTRLPASVPVQPERDFDLGHPVLGRGDDISVGALVRQRLGDQVVDRLVDPMLGGVYAGRADELSLQATMPGLAAAGTFAHTLTGAVRAALAAAPRPPGIPVFGSLRGGLGELVPATAAASAATIRLGLPVRELAPVAGRWRLTVGATPDAQQVSADAVVLAVPARPAARLLDSVDPALAGAVGQLDYASVALVSLALPPDTPLPRLSGFLVPAAEGREVKAVTFVTQKWPHRRGDDDPVLVRASVGRFGDPGPLRLADQELVRLVGRELSDVLGGVPAPLASHVQRWGGALPQYPVGHPARVAQVRATLPAGLAVAGAGYDGVGIPACIRSGETAAEQVSAVLEESTS